MAITPEKRAKMEKMVYAVFDALDPTGTNTKYYRSLFEPMSMTQFDKWFKAFFADDTAYLVLNICDYENTIMLENIERGAKVMNVPLFENVCTPHVTMDKSKAIWTHEPVPVGYLNIKRTQQTVSKKNGISTNIDSRSALTAQVTGADKNGRESDLENTMLASMGMEATMRELNGPRADDMRMKNQMLQQIATNGYTTMADMESLPENKTTLNTANTYMLGMHLNSDLVTSGLMLKNTIREEL